MTFEFFFKEISTMMQLQIPNITKFSLC